MRPEAIERALLEDRVLAPSPDFSKRVMLAVRHRAEEREGLAFPWLRLVAGLVTCAGLTVSGIVILWLGSGPAALDSATLISALERSPAAPAVAWASTALVASYLLAWGSLRLAGHRR